MIKRILVALDSDTDTRIAVNYAATMARRTDALVTGLALVDTGSIAAHTKGGGIGSMHFAEKAREQLTAETREHAETLIAQFQEQAEAEGVRTESAVRAGTPAEQIIGAMRFHDLLLVGRSPHFFYGHPDQETKTLERIINGSMSPTLVVHEDHRPVKHVVIAYDGSRPASKALQGFVQLKPFGEDPLVEVLHVADRESEASEALLRHAQVYLEAHGFTVRATTRTGNNPHTVILSHAESVDADLLVVGTHAVSKMREFAFGSTTAQLIAKATLPLFLDN